MSYLAIVKRAEIEHLIAEARKLGLIFEREGSRLRVKGSQKVPESLMVSLKKHRWEIIEFLDEELQGESRKFEN